MKTVLGLSLTSSSVGWVLLDRDDPDAPALDHDAFDVRSEAATDGDIGRHLAAVRGAQAIATSSGHEVRSIGVTWTDDAEAKGSLLLKALPDLGFDDVHAVLLPQATRAWAKALSRQQDFDQCAVCVLEPGAMTVLVVHTGFGTVRTSVTHVRENADGVARWLTDVFDRNGWQPQDVYVVGARGDLELTSGSLEIALPMPVVSSDEAQLSLARGAALSVPLHTDVDTEADDALVAAAAPAEVGARRRPRIGPHARAGAALVAGVIALFVVGPELAGHNRIRPAEERPPANSSASVTSATSVTAATPAAAQTPPAAPPPAAADSRPLVVAPAPEPVVPMPPAPVAAVVEAPPIDEQVAATAVVAPAETAAEPDAVPVEVPPEPLAAAEPAAPAESAPVAPALAPPAPVPPLAPQPGPAPGPAAPPPPPDPVQVVLSPFFGALP